MTDHRPEDLLGDPLPLPSPWESLARHARWLAEAAEQVAALPAEQRRTDEHDHLAQLDERALAVRALVAPCRRTTYTELRTRGWSVADIARHWDVGVQAVYKVLGRTRP